MDKPKSKHPRGGKDGEKADTTRIVESLAIIAFMAVALTFAFGAGGPTILGGTPQVIQPTGLAKGAITIKITDPYTGAVLTGVVPLNGTVVTFNDTSCYHAPITAQVTRVWLSVGSNNQGLARDMPLANGTLFNYTDHYTKSLSGTDKKGRAVTIQANAFRYQPMETVEVVIQTGYNPGPYVNNTVNNWFSSAGWGTQSPDTYGGAADPNNPNYCANPFYISPYAGTASTGVRDANGNLVSSQGLYQFTPALSETQGALCYAEWSTTYQEYETNTMYQSRGTHAGYAAGYQRVTQGGYQPVPVPTYPEYAKITTSICPMTWGDFTYLASHPGTSPVSGSWRPAVVVDHESDARPVSIEATVHLVGNTEAITNNSGTWIGELTYTNGTKIQGSIDVKMVSAVCGFGVKDMSVIDNTVTHSNNYTGYVPTANGKIATNIGKKFLATNPSQPTATTPIQTSTIESGLNPVTLAGGINVHDNLTLYILDGGLRSMGTGNNSLQIINGTNGFDPYDYANNCGLDTTLNISRRLTMSPRIDIGVAYATVTGQHASRLGTTLKWLVQNYKQDIAWPYAVLLTNSIIAFNETFPVSVISENDAQAFSSDGTPIDITQIKDYGSTSWHTNPFRDNLSVTMILPTLNTTAHYWWDDVADWWNQVWQNVGDWLNGLLSGAFAPYFWAVIAIAGLICVTYIVGKTARPRAESAGAESAGRVETHFHFHRGEK
jgi:hypothetical protein